MATQFVLLRILDMRGVDLDVFDFDYDLVWAGLFLNAEGIVYGRYGSRAAASSEAELSLAGLNYALERSLAEHRRKNGARSASRSVSGRTVEQYAAARNVEGNACIHCHQVYNFGRAALIEAREWRTDQVWIYPRPENLGLSLARDQGDVVRAVEPASAAAHAGFRAGDRLLALDGRPIASIADVQHALQRAPTTGTLRVDLLRDDRALTAELPLTRGWRATDLSWRASTRRLGPHPSVGGEDLSVQEKATLGVGATDLAFRQGSFPSLAARQAGIRQNDIILGVDGKALRMTAAQFGVYIRLNYHVGDAVSLNIIREGKRLDISLKLPEVAHY